MLCFGGECYRIPCSEFLEHLASDNGADMHKYNTLYTRTLNQHVLTLISLYMIFWVPHRKSHCSFYNLRHNKNISIISKENDGDISPCLFLQQPISYIVNYDSFIRQIHEVDEDNIDVFPFLETDLLYLLYGLLIVIWSIRQPDQRIVHRLFRQIFY